MPELPRTSNPRPLDLTLDLIQAAHARPVPDDPSALTVMTDEELRPGLEAIVEGREGAALWVFAYGSLMWRPEFPVAEQRSAPCGASTAGSASCSGASAARPSGRESCWLWTAAGCAGASPSACPMPRSARR